MLPVTAADFKSCVSDVTATLCGNFRNTLLKLPVLIYKLAAYVLGDDGNFTAAFVSDLSKALLPTGSITMAGCVLDSNWLLCNGQAVSRTTYANLFAAIQTTFGVGDGATTFNVPKMDDIVPIGVSGTKALGNAYGRAEIKLADNEISHYHRLWNTDTDTSAAGSPETDAEKYQMQKLNHSGDGDCQFTYHGTDTLATLGKTGNVNGAAEPAVDPSDSSYGRKAFDNTPNSIAFNFYIRI